MVDVSKLRMDKIEHPSTFTPRPTILCKTMTFLLKKRRRRLIAGSKDARQQLTASSEGMAGSKEGVDPSNHSRLGEIQRAKDKIGDKPKHKPSQ
jgi:hypothetical protein